MRVLCVGPDNTLITGQSLAFKNYIENSKHDCKVIYNAYSKAKILGFLLYILKVVYIRVFFKFDCVYFTSSRTKLGFIRDFVLVSLFYSKKIPIVNHLHGADFKSFRDCQSLVYKRMIDFVYNRVTSSIVNTKSMTEQFSYFPLMNVITVENCFSPELVDEIAIKSKINDFANGTERIKLLYLSNLIKTKGYIEIVKAVKKLNSNAVAFELTIAGSSLGNQKVLQELDDLISDVEFISYLGPVDFEEKKKLLLSSNVVCLPTYYPTETQPLVLLEGMATGNLVLTTQHNYISDFIMEENGFLISTQNVDEIVNALVEVESNRDNTVRIMYNNAFKYSSRFSLNKYVSGIDRLIEDSYGII